MTEEQAFPPTSWASWKERATAELGGGADFESALVTRTPEGVRIQPVYETPPPGSATPAGFATPVTGVGPACPGEAPHLRGAGRLGPLTGPTRICPIVQSLSLEEAAERIREEIGGGMRALWFHRIGFAHLDELDQLLDQVDPAETEILVRPTLPAHAVSAFWIAWILRRHPAPAAVRLHFGLDPLGRLARTGLFDLERSERDTMALAERVREQFPHSTALAVSTAPYHNAGATATEELAAALATGTAYLRWLTGAGFDLDDAASQIFFRFPLSADQFLEIAKLRAFRFCWSRVLEASGYPGSVGPRIHTVDSDRMLSVYDPWVNMLRTTLSTFAAIAGGSDLHTPAPWDTRLGGSDPLARRIARNTGTILLEETRLTHVVDPAGGSSYVESLTQELAEAAWSLFQELDRDGIEAELLSGRFRARIGETWSEREQELRRRSRPVTGVSEYANLDESRPACEGDRQRKAARGFGLRRRKARDARAGIQITLAPTPNDTLEEAIVHAGESATVDELIDAWPIGRSGEIESFPVRHDGDPFEEIRSRAEAEAGAPRPAVFLANLGPHARHGARASFARSAFAAGGIAAVNGNGTDGLPPEGAADEITRQFRESGASVACLCGSDAEYATHGNEVVAALREAHATWVLRAGRPSSKVPADQIVDDWIYLGSDLPASLEKALVRAAREAQP